MGDYASVCLLSYQRPGFIQEAIRTARDNADFPVEIIVHDDGSPAEVQTMLLGLLERGEISKLILNPPGQNQGVGESVRVAFSAASGSWLIKADQDLIFQPGWLRRATGILSSPVNVAHARRERIGMVGLFHYHVAPCETNAMRLFQGPGFQIHRDFVSSAFVIERELWDELGQYWPTHSTAFAEDIEFKGRLLHEGFALALPDEDLAANRGFGVGPSTVVPRQKGVKPDGSPDYEVATIHHNPVVFGSSLMPTPTNPEPALENRVELIEEDGPPPSSPFRPGVVITACPGREGNLRMVLDSLDRQTYRPVWVVIVFDGCDAWDVTGHTYFIRTVAVPKHQPGMEQPRNIGVAQLLDACPTANFVWFVDSDVVMADDALEHYAQAHNEHGGEDVIMYGPYDWMAPGGAGIGQPDGRWEMFRNHGREHIHRGTGSTNVALGAFGGNILYPIKDFLRIGGFWNELHHGRCEDGELGIRALSLGCAFAIVAEARGFHQWHPVDHAGAVEKNKRDVPMLNARHPWLQTQGLVVTEGDGARFEWVCPKCGEQVNCLLSWEHKCDSPS